MKTLLKILRNRFFSFNSISILFFLIVPFNRNFSQNWRGAVLYSSQSGICNGSSIAWVGPSSFISAGTAMVPGTVGSCLPPPSSYFTVMQLQDTICLSNNFSIEVKLKTSNGVFRNDIGIGLTSSGKNTGCGLIGYNPNVPGDQTSAVQFTSAYAGDSSTKNIAMTYPITSGYQTIKLKYFNNILTFFRDGLSFFSLPYNGDICNVTSLFISFKGSGEVDWIRILDELDNEIWREEFLSSTTLTPYPNNCNPNLNINLSSIYPTCSKNTLQLLANPLSSNANISYSWTGPNGFKSNERNPIISNPTAIYNGLYSCTTKLNSCNTAFQTQTINASFVLPSALPFTISATKKEVCSKDTSVLQVVSNGIITKWTTGLSTLNIDTGKIVTAKPISTTTYIAEVTDINGCNAKDSITIVAKPLPLISLTAFPNKSICPSDSVNLSATSPSAISFNWQPNLYLNKTTSNLVTSKPLSSLTYTVSATDIKGCKGFNDISINLIDFKPPKIGNDTSICMGDSLILNPGNYTTYLWSNGTNTNSIVAKNIGNYYVTTSDIFGCKGSDTMSIISINTKPSNYLPNDTIVCRGQQIRITVNGFSKYNWSNGAITETATLSDIGKYFLSVSDKKGCKGIDSIILINKGCIPFQIPNAFTPNGDNKNDIFRPLITQKFTNYLFRVYNRFGQIVFETEDVFAGWNGTILGRKQPTGAYVYLIKFNDFDNTPFQHSGTLLLIR